MLFICHSSLTKDKNSILIHCTNKSICNILRNRAQAGQVHASNFSCKGFMQGNEFKRRLFCSYGLRAVGILLTMIGCGAHKITSGDKTAGSNWKTVVRISSKDAPQKYRALARVKQMAFFLTIDMVQ